MEIALKTLMPSSAPNSKNAIQKNHDSVKSGQSNSKGTNAEEIDDSLVDNNRVR